LTIKYSLKLSVFSTCQIIAGLKEFSSFIEGEEKSPATRFSLPMRLHGRKKSIIRAYANRWKIDRFYQECQTKLRIRRLYVKRLKEQYQAPLGV